MRVTKCAGDKEPSADWPWWTLVEALSWIIGEDGYVPPSTIESCDGDVEWTAREMAAKELRTALADDRLTAYGIRSERGKPRRINPVDWVSLDVPISEFRGVSAWQTEPYSKVVVAKDEMQRLWPVPWASDGDKCPPRRRGRPLEYDWERILQFAAEERSRSPSGRNLEMVVQVRCRDELGYPEGAPSLTAIRNHLTAAQ